MLDDRCQTETAVRLGGVRWLSLPGAIWIYILPDPSISCSQRDLTPEHNRSSAEVLTTTSRSNMQFE